MGLECIEPVVSILGMITGCAALGVSIKANKFAKEANEIAKAGIQPFLRISEVKIKMKSDDEIRKNKTFKIKRYTAQDLSTNDSFRIADDFVDQSKKMVLELVLENEGVGVISHIEIKEFLLAYGTEETFEDQHLTHQIVAPPVEQPLNAAAIEAPALCINKENKSRVVNILLEEYNGFDDSILYDFSETMDTAVLWLRVDIFVSENIKKECYLKHFFKKENTEEDTV